MVKLFCISLALIYLHCRINQTVHRVLYYPFLLSSLGLKKQGEDITLFMPSGNWSVEGKPPKGVEVMKGCAHCYKAVLKEKENTGEEIPQLQMILYHFLSLVKLQGGPEGKGSQVMTSIKVST